MTVNQQARPTLVLGSGSCVRELVREITARPDAGYALIGVVTNDTLTVGIPVLGALDDLQPVLQQHAPQVIIVAFPHQSAGRFDAQLLDARVSRNISIEQGEAVYEKLTGKLPIETLAPGSLIYSGKFRCGPAAQFCSRLLSLSCALAAVLVLAPLLLLIAVLIRLDSPGGAFFVQERIGCGGKPFRLYKFRTMRPDPGHKSEWEGDNIHRITRIGSWLRKYRLDELPQFFNVLAGDMNLVGPRPHPACSLELLQLVSRNTPVCGMPIPYYSLRYSVRPGITGWAQVRYRYANSIDEELEKLRYDLYYIKHAGFWFDIRILLETVGTIWHGQKKPVVARPVPVPVTPPVLVSVPRSSGKDLRPVNPVELKSRYAGT